MSAVYFIQAGPTRHDAWIKIGHTNRLARRLMTLQIGCPIDLHLIAAIELGEYAPRIEHRLHKTFALLHRKGSEWFRAHPLLFAAMNHLCEFKLDPLKWQSVEWLDFGRFMPTLAELPRSSQPNHEEHW